MHIYVQWAKSKAEDWTRVEIASQADVRHLPRRPVPGKGDRVDADPGWVNAINYQGVIFHGYDHIAVEYNPLLDLVVITGWQDDPEDLAPELLSATQWTFQLPGPDPAIGGLINVRQRRTVFGGPEATRSYPPREVRPLEDFVVPPVEATLHGIWMKDALYAAHMSALTTHGWREWVQ